MASCIPKTDMTVEEYQRRSEEMKNLTQKAAELQGQLNEIDRQLKEAIPKGTTPDSFLKKLNEQEASLDKQIETLNEKLASLDPGRDE